MWLSNETLENYAINYFSHLKSIIMDNSMTVQCLVTGQ